MQTNTNKMAQKTKYASEHSMGVVNAKNPQLSGQGQKLIPLSFTIFTNINLSYEILNQHSFVPQSPMD